MELVSIQSTKHLETFRQDWSIILQEEKNRNPFLEFEYFFHWWKSFGYAKRIVVYAIKENRKIIAFLPFQIEDYCGVSLFRFAGLPQALFMGVICRRTDMDRVLMYAFDQLRKKYKHCIFRLENFLEHEQITKLSTYLLARNIKKEITATNIPSITLTTLSTPSMMLIKERTLIEKLGPVEVKKGRLEDIKHLLIGQNQQEQDLLLNLAMESSSNFQVDIQILVHQKEVIAYSYALVCRGFYVNLNRTSQKDYRLFSPEKILLSDNLLENKKAFLPFTIIDPLLPSITDSHQKLQLKNIAFTSGTRLSSAVLKCLNKSNIDKKRLIEKISTATYNNRPKRKELLFAKLDGMNIHSNYPFHKISEEHLRRVDDRSVILPKIARGFEGYYDQLSKEYFWVNEHAIIEDNFFHPLEKKSIFIENWEEGDLEKILSFVQKAYRPRSVFLTCHPKDKDRKKQLRLFGFRTYAIKS